jgi:hypothetical protein
VFHKNIDQTKEMVTLRYNPAICSEIKEDKQSFSTDYLFFSNKIKNQ